MDNSQAGLRDMLTALDGIPDRESDGPRQTLAACYAKRILRTYRPPSDESSRPPTPVRILVANGLRISGEPAGALVSMPEESPIAGVGFAAAYAITHSLATKADYAKATMGKIRSGRVGKKDGGGYKREPVRTGLSITPGDCVVRAGRV